MRGTKAVLCPKCGALNRATWEFCARCNEALEGGAAVEESSGSPAAPETEGASSAPANTIALAAVLALGILGLAAWRALSDASPAERPDPSLFTMGTQPPALPSPPPATGAGAAYEAGRRALTSGDVPTAVARLAEAAAGDPQNAYYKAAYGHALWRSGDRDAALAVTAEAAALDPRLQIQYARSLDVAGKGEDAARQYRAILVQNPGALTVHADLGRLLFRTGDYKGAASHLQTAVAARPDDPVLQQEFAYSLDQAGDRSEAAAAYRRVLEKAPDAVISRSLLADNLVDQGRKDEAMAVLQEGLRRQPQAPLLQRQMGSVLERSGRPGDAAAAYRNYATLAPNAPDAQELLARAARLEAKGGKP